MITITRVAGIGAMGNSGDDGPAINAQLGWPLGLAVTSDDGFLIADSYYHVARKVSPSGEISRVAGSPGAPGNSGDDGPATDAQLASPHAVVVTADDGFLIADASNHAVRKVSASGTITRVAGTGVLGNSGDDGPAIDAQLNFPVGLAVTADGGFLIADTSNHAVRKVSASGTITRVAGTGVPGNSGDDGPATDAQLAHPWALAVTTDGGFLVTSPPYNVVRKVSPSGTITRVAGTGASGYTGDDGLAMDAKLSYPVALAVTTDGSFLIVDSANHAVRKVSASGTITRVAGTGVSGNSGDDGPATSATLAGPYALALTANGSFLISDWSAHVVRKVS